jgi:hypothetical protein
VAATGSQALRLRMSSEGGMCCLVAGRVLAADQVRDGSEMIVFVGEGQRLYITVRKLNEVAVTRKRPAPPRVPKTRLNQYRLLSSWLSYGTREPEN